MDDIKSKITPIDINNPNQTKQFQSQIFQNIQLKQENEQLKSELNELKQKYEKLEQNYLTITSTKSQTITNNENSLRNLQKILDTEMNDNDNDSTMAASSNSNNNQPKPSMVLLYPPLNVRLQKLNEKCVAVKWTHNPKNVFLKLDGYNVYINDELCGRMKSTDQVASIDGIREVGEYRIYLKSYFLDMESEKSNQVITRLKKKSKNMNELKKPIETNKNKNNLSSKSNSEDLTPSTEEHNTQNSSTDGESSSLEEDDDIDEEVEEIINNKNNISKSSSNSNNDNNKSTSSNGFSPPVQSAQHHLKQNVANRIAQNLNSLIPSTKQVIGTNKSNNQPNFSVLNDYEKMQLLKQQQLNSDNYSSNGSLSDNLILRKPFSGAVNTNPNKSNDNSDDDDDDDSSQLTNKLKILDRFQLSNFNSSKPPMSPPRVASK